MVVHVSVYVRVEIRLKDKMDSSKNNAWCTILLLHVQLTHILWVLLTAALAFCLGLPAYSPRIL